MAAGAAVARADASSALYVNDAASAHCTDTGDGAGSSATPFCSIQAAANAAVPGDTVQIAGGTYAGAVDITSAGTAAAPIVLQAGGNVSIVDGTGQTGVPALGFTRASYVTVEGAGESGSFTIKGVAVNASSHITVDRVDSSISSGSTGYGAEITGASSDVAVTRSELSGAAGGLFVGPGSTGDVLSTNEVSGEIDVEGSTDTAVTSNTVYGSTARSASSGVIEVGDGADGTSIENNIVMVPGLAPGPFGILVDSTSSAGTTEDYNVIPPWTEPVYSWAGVTYRTQAAFTQATGQGEHDSNSSADLGPGLYTTRADAPQLNSANSAAPGMLDTDLYGNPCTFDPVVAVTGAGSPAYCDRGAVQNAYHTTVTATATATGAKTVELGSAMSQTMTLPGASYNVVAAPTPAISYVVDWGDGTTSAPTPGSAIYTATAMTHTYAKNGNYTITTTAEEPGGTSTSTITSFTTAGSTYTPTGPTRILDTRKGTGAPLAKVPVGSSITVQVGGVGAIPAGITAVALNLTVTDTTGSGFLSVVPAGDGASTSNLNYAAGQTVANSVIVPVSESGAITVYNTGPSGSVDVVADISGYFSPSTGSGYSAATLDRILNTGNGTGAAKAKVPAKSGIPVTIAGVDSIPAGVTAVAVHVTVFDTTGIGWIAAEPDGAGVPGTSSLNYGPGQIVSNTVIVPVASDGRIELYNGGGTTPVDLIADVSGYFSPTSTAEYVPVSPIRDWDSRNDGRALPANGSQDYELQISEDTEPVEAPAGSSIVTNITVTDETTIGFITAYPYGTPNPGTSNLNYAKDQTLAGLSILQATGADNYITVANQSNGTSDIVLDVFGYFSTS
jgi:hypothetical protein